MSLRIVVHSSLIVILLLKLLYRKLSQSNIWFYREKEHPPPLAPPLARAGGCVRPSPSKSIPEPIRWKLVRDTAKYCTSNYRNL